LFAPPKSTPPSTRIWQFKKIKIKSETEDNKNATIKVIVGNSAF
jgi:hypothetical protein